MEPHPPRSRPNEERNSRLDRPGSTSDPAIAARELCLRLLSVRPRTRAELATALLRRRFDDQTIAEVLDRYSDTGMIDDEAFAQAWVASRHHSRGLARPALEGELRRRGVAAEVVGTALSDLDAATEEATARAMIERRLRIELGGRRPSGQMSSDEGDHDRELAGRERANAALIRRLVGMLARKGYGPGVAYRVVKEAMASHPDVADVADLVDLDAHVEDPVDLDQLRS